MPFQKGQSGNPSGRPKVIAEVRDLARQYTEAAIRTLVELMEGAENEAVRKSAADSLLDRGYGKATQPIAGDGDAGGLTIVIKKFTQED